MGTTREIFIANLRRRRAELSWTQAGAAEKIGISHSGYAQIEYGKVWPAPETVDKIRKAFDMELSQFFVDPNAVPSAPAPRADLQEILERLDRMEAASAAPAAAAPTAFPAELDHLVKLITRAESPALLKRLVEQASSFLDSKAKRVQKQKKRA